VEYTYHAANKFFLAIKNAIKHLKFEIHVSSYILKHIHRISREENFFKIVFSFYFTKKNMSQFSSNNNFFLIFLNILAVGVFPQNSQIVFQFNSLIFAAKQLQPFAKSFVVLFNTIQVLQLT
jgi:hypothetical protein